MSLRMGLFVRGALAAALMVGPAQAVTFTGATSASSTNALGNGTYNYGSPFATAGSLTTYRIDNTGLNLGGAAYTAGDPLLFDGSAPGASGTVYNIAIDSSITANPTGATLNPSSVTFNDVGGAGKSYVLLRASTSASTSNSLNLASGTAATGNMDSYSSVSPFGANSGGGTSDLILDTGYTGTVTLRAQAQNAATGTTTIRGGTLVLNAANALPTNGSNSNNPGTVTLAGGKLVININEGNVETVEGSTNPATGQFNGALNVTANSTLSNGAINFDGTARRQDLWGGSSGPVALSGGVTLNIETGGGATIKGAITGVAGSAGTVNLGSSANYLRLNTTTGGNTNINYNLGTGGAALDLAVAGTYNLGSLSGANNTSIRGNSAGGVSTTSVAIGALNGSGSYGGQIMNGFGASNSSNTASGASAVVSHTGVTKSGTGTLMLTGENRFSGATTINAGTLQAGGSSSFGDGSVAITANAGGTLDLNGNTQEAGKSFVVNGGSLVNNSATAVTIHTGASANFASAATNSSGLVYGAGTDTGTPATSGSWSMNGGTVPTVTIAGGGGTGATAEAKMQVGLMRLNAGAAGGALGAVGSGYLKAPTVTFSAPSDPNGRTAKAFLQIGAPGSATAGQVTGIQIIDAGWGYTSVPTVTIDNTGTGGTGFRPVFAMAVNEIEMTTAGSGYTSAPSVTIGNLGTISGTTNAAFTTALGAPTATGGFGGVTLNAITTNVIGGSGDISIPAAVSGAGGFSKTGGGTVTLSGTNPYAGSTSVNQGKLLVNGANTGTGSVTVLSSATLGGTGSIAGAVTVNSGGAIAPGASIESLDVGSLTLAGTMYIEYDASAATPIDVLNATLSLDVSAGTVDFQQIGSSLTAPSYIFANYGSLVGTFSTVLNMPAGYVLDYGTGTNSSISLITAIPEAGAFLAGTVVSLLVGAGTMVRRRK